MANYDHPPAAARFEPMRAGDYLCVNLLVKGVQPRLVGEKLPYGS
jgi:hypothetical protein